MTRSELINKVTEQHTDLSGRQIEQCINVVFSEITGALSKGDRVELRGFGVFEVRQRQARKGRNPKTGKTVDVPSKKVPFFKAGKLLKEHLNPL